MANSSPDCTDREKSTSQAKMFAKSVASSILSPSDCTARYRLELTTPAEEKPDEVIGKADQTATRTGVRKIVRAVIEDFVREQQTAPAVVPREPAPPARSGPVPRAKVLAGPVRDFVCEDDVRQALRDGRKITVSARTIMTPSALDAAEGRKVFIWE